MNWINMDKVATDKKALQNFALVMAIALAVLGSAAWLKQKPVGVYFFAAALVFLFSGLFASAILKPVYIIWMRFAFVLSWINTRLILAILYYAIFTPTAICLALFKKDPLLRAFEKDKDSYWIAKEKKEFKPADYEKQY